VLTVLHSFNAIDGAYPRWGLIRGSDGALYGTTEYGGAFSGGTIFRVTDEGIVESLYSFNPALAHRPWGPLLGGGDGRLYGMTFYSNLTATGGSDGVLYEFEPGSRQFTVDHTLDDTIDGSQAYGAFGIGTDRKAYGANSAGGAFGGGTLFGLDVVIANWAPEPYFTATPNPADAANASGAVVRLDSAGTWDEDDDVLTFAWHGPFGTLAGAAADATLPIGTSTVTLEVTDSQGVMRSIGREITVVDQRAPVLTVPAGVTAEATGPAGAVVSFTAAATDAVDGAEPVTCSPASGSVFALGTTTVVCSAEDSSGNSSSASFVVTVRDTTPPALTISEPVPAGSAPGGTVITFEASAVDLVDGPRAVTCAPPSGSVFAPGTTVVTCSASDTRGNTGTRQLTVTVSVSTPLVMTVPPEVRAEATGSSGAIVTFAASARGVGGDVPVVCAPASGSTFPIGSTTVVCSATDSNGGTASASFPVIVQDTTAPLVTVPAPITVTVGSPAGGPVSFAASAADLVDGPVAATCTPASGSTFPVGVTTVTCSARDASGNESQAGFTVTLLLVDATPPVIAPQADLVIEATGPAGTTAVFSLTAQDAVDGVRPVVCAPPSGSLFPLGTTLVSCSASDTRGNTASAAFRVTVRDTTAPRLSLPGSISVTSTSRAGIPVTYSALASDLVDLAPIVTCQPGSGSTFPIGSSTVNCSARDASGNTIAGSFTVTVTLVDTTPPVITAPSSFTLEATGPAGARAAFSATAVDGLDGAVRVLCAPASGSTFPLGTTAVTCTATDAHGNVASSGFTVTVVDTTPPVLSSVPGPLTVEATGPAGAMVVYALPPATDLVAGAVPVLCVPAPGATFPLGTTTVTCTAADAAGNSVTARFAVTVRDTTPPRVIVPAPMTIPATGSAGVVVTFSASATDPVDGPLPATCSPASGSTFPIGVTPVTCSATDRSGNRGTATFTITVGDTVPPVVKSIAASPGTLWPPNKKMVPVRISGVAVDAGSGLTAGEFRVIDEYGTVQPRGTFVISPSGAYAFTVSLQSWREGTDMDGRHYTIEITIRDAAGNRTTARVTVVCPHDQSDKTRDPGNGEGDLKPGGGDDRNGRGDQNGRDNRDGRNDRDGRDGRN
jgi:large repetitive protein